LPTRLTTNYPRLQIDDEFEDLILDLCRTEWNDPSASDRHGRSGQEQFGVDVFGHPDGNPDIVYGVQCKLRTGDKQLSENEIEEEVRKAKKFDPPLKMFIIATDAPRDSKTQGIVRKINEREVHNGSFPVAIWFWDSICDRIASQPRVIVKYFQDFFNILTTAPEAERLVDVPLRILSTRLYSAGFKSALDEALELRGIQVYSEDEYASQADLPPDGVLLQYDSDGPSRLQRFSSKTVQFGPFSCPLFICLPGGLHQAFCEMYEEMGGSSSKLVIINSEATENEKAAFIFSRVINYGYRRRGSLTTIDLAIRSSANRFRKTFLDINWSTRISPSHYPSIAEWENVLKPAMEDVQVQVNQLGDGNLIQIRSVLQLPAACAWGSSFNIRLSRLAVWARETGISDFRQQYWLSDARPEPLTFSQEWVMAPQPGAKSIVIELTNGRNIHAAVDDYSKVCHLETDAWLQIGHEKTDPRFSQLDQDCAVAFADQVGQILRSIQPYGFTDIHLFLTMPSALVILVGQRLQACGRIHLYWYTNPSYQYAFTLQ
jgi:hypothetical protein